MPMFKIPESLENKYRFVTLAAKRAEQLQLGALPRVDNALRRKVTVVAQEEVANGLVDTWRPEELPDEGAAMLVEDEE
jgi:DNA-directed RNA polymerase omega subunit